MSETSQRTGHAAWRAIRVVLVVVAVALLLPYALVPLYRSVDPVSTVMVWRWARGARVERTVVPIDHMAAILPRSVIAAEDARFCSHHGVDFGELREVVKAETHGVRRPRGGSSITQQLAKNLFLWPGRSYVRKALEFPLALWIDLVIPKRRQLEIYLNVAEWGPNGEFGAEAGARRAFGRSASSVSATEAALLAAILPNPVRRNARQPSAGLRRLAAIYQSRAAGSGDIDSCIRSPGSR
jgi:monofunctional glycosyltransferase